MGNSPGDTQTPVYPPARTQRKKERRAGRSDRDFAASLKQHISSIAETNRKANIRRELALLHCTTELRFLGEVIIQSRDDAILVARAASRPSSQFAEGKRAFYVDGSSFHKRGKRHARRCAGAAAVFQADHGEGWEERVFSLPPESKPFATEMAAIAEGLAVALSQTLTQPAGMRSVVIFSDCQGALIRIDELRQRELDEEWLRSDTNSVLRKLITRSQHFRRLGLSVELRWVPSHSGVEGNIRADRAARSAAEDDSAGPRFTNGIYLDEGLRLIELEVTGKDNEDRFVKTRRQTRRQRFMFHSPEDHLRLSPQVQLPTRSTSELSPRCVDALPPNPTSEAPKPAKSQE